MKSNKPNPERDKWLADMYAKGFMPSALASTFGITTTRVIQILNKLGVRKPKWKWASAETGEKIYQMQAKGYSQSAIGREVGLSRERIRQIEAKALRKLRHPSWSRRLKDYLE